MGKWWKRKRERVSVVLGILAKASGWVDVRLRKVAAYLNAKAAHWGRRQVLTALCVFCVGIGGCSVWIIWQSFHQPARAVEVKMIRAPKHSLLEREEELPRQGLSEREASGIARFQHYLDSLKGSVTGRQVYDSLARVRPGLLDSLQLVQSIFSEQLNMRENGKKK